MGKEDLIEQACVTLLKEGYAIKRVRGCFDLVARGEHTLLLRMLGDANALTPEGAAEMKRAAGMVNASVLVIAERAGRPLEPGIVYSRFGVYTTTMETFRESLHDRLPMVLSTSAGPTLRLSGQKVRAKRDEMELSRLELSRRLGVSPRMLDRYESDSEVTLQRGFRIHEVLGEEVFLPVELFDIPLDYAQPQDEISLKYSELGFRVQEFRKAPFDVIARQDRELIFTEMGKVHPEMQSLSRLLDADNLVIFDERAPKDKDLPSMRKEEFLELQEARELVKFLREF